MVSGDKICTCAYIRDRTNKLLWTVIMRTTAVYLKSSNTHKEELNEKRRKKCLNFYYSCLYSHKAEFREKEVFFLKRKFFLVQCRMLFLMLFSGSAFLFFVLNFWAEKHFLFLVIKLVLLLWAVEAYFL